MDIAPDFTDQDWKGLTFKSEADWRTAVGAMERRLRERFLKPAALLLSRRRSGFAVLALECLLIETLQQFREGVPETPYVVRGGRRVLASEEYFVAFLTSPDFGQGFDQTTAELFYRTIRCGILHQAEVKGSSLVRRDRPLVSLTADGKGVIVNPRLLHQRIETTFDAYLRELSTPTNPQLRERFRKKMNHIARA